MQTVLVLDSQAPSIVMKALEGLTCIPIVVNEIAHARHVLLNFRVDLWVCDLMIDDLNFKQLHSESMGRNAKMRILLTGNPVTKLRAATLIKKKRADKFVAKPWKPLLLKRAITTLAQQPRLMGTAHPAEARRLIVTPSGTHLRVKTASRSKAAMPKGIDEGRYRLDELLGQGGMGRVYRAYDQLLDMEVAVKLLHYEFSRDEEAIGQLKEETRICLQLLHRHIVRIYNLELRSGMLLIIMEYVKGGSLNTLIKQMPEGIPPEMVLQIVSVMADALGYAHRKGVLHKDITPGNVLVSDEGVLKLIDFGIADRMNRQKLSDDYVIGTPEFMSPEQLRGETLDERTDVYSTAVLTHQMLTGRLPSAPEASVEALAFQPHPPLEGLPSAVHQALESALSFEPHQRCASMDDFMALLRVACKQDYSSGSAAS